LLFDFYSLVNYIILDYFPIHLHKTCDLPADRSYIFGYHPHGIISFGAIGNFATEATGFEEKFPNINLRLLTLKSNFRIPFYGFYLSLMGLCDASKESCNYILEKGNGNSIMLVLGGAKEALDAHPSSEHILTLKNRKGFIKVGLANGASLVPVFSFGENDLYEQISNPRGSKVRQFQMLLQKKLGYSTPFFRGRGIFQYAVGFLPQRHPIHTCVGSPIELPKLKKEEITSEIIDRYHQLYMDALTNLFDTNKEKYGSKDAFIKYVNDTD
jgi:2-acylglycerol O-acyltransferase 2